MAGSIADELAPPAASEAVDAVADFDSYSSEPTPTLPEVQPEPIATAPEPQQADQPSHDGDHASSAESVEPETDKAARRRSTVREKVAFLAEAPPAASAPADAGPSEQPASPAPAQPAADPAADGQPRRAGWWSRRFGSGE